MSSEKEGCCHGSDTEHSHSHHAEHKSSCASDKPEDKAKQIKEEENRVKNSSSNEAGHKKDGGCCSH